MGWAGVLRKVGVLKRIRGTARGPEVVVTAGVRFSNFNPRTCERYDILTTRTETKEKEVRVETGEGEFSLGLKLGVMFSQEGVSPEKKEKVKEYAQEFGATLFEAYPELGGILMTRNKEGEEGEDNV